MADILSSSEAQLHATNMEQTLRELQRKVRDHEAQLRKIRSTQRDTPESPAAQAKVIQTALSEVTNSEPFLPFPGSVLPALLALRKTHATIQNSKSYLATHGSDVEKQRRQLESDRASLKDQRLITDALKARIQALQEELDSKAEMQPEDGARKRLGELKRKKQKYDVETSALMKSLLGFIENHLAPMLAAEELGGPVVGEMMEIDSEDLAAGFNAQGNLKKAKDGGENADKRQRRIDEIWGGDGQEAGPPGQSDETGSAGSEMRQLTEELLNRLVEAKGDNSASYVKLGRESAATRFLVRSKAAQFHPKDATRLKLVDFGRELED